MLLRPFQNIWPCSSFLRSLSSGIQEVFKGLDKDPDRLSVAAKVVIQEYRDGSEASRTDLLTKLAQECGVRHEALANAIHLYSKNPAMVHEVRAASCPVHYHLLRSVGNQMDGIKLVCGIRGDLLALIKTTETKQLVSTLRRLEESARDLLTTWFCLSNLKLNRLTWQSPGDILHKIAEYEAVHPVRGLLDFRTRIGPLRRCFYFTHEAMPREPLVMIHVALMKRIGDSVQEIVSGKASSGREDEQTTAIYYSITSTQKGLAGIDLGNLLIKQVAAQITREVPTVQTHSTLSPMPGFRSWLIRGLKGHSEFGDLVNEKALSLLAKATREGLSREKATDLLLQVISNDKIVPTQLEPLRDLLLHFAARYLYESKRNGFAVNPVANFHLRNGAELYRLNWLADTSFRGISNSLGVMVNYRYYLDRVAQNSAAYTHQKVIQTNQQVLSLL